jgi:hypothetical protein
MCWKKTNFLKPKQRNPHCPSTGSVAAGAFIFRISFALYVFLLTFVPAIARMAL